MFKTFTILSHYLRAKHCMNLSIDALRAHQRKHHSRILDYARTHSPFYREHSGGIIDKKIMMEHFTRFNTVGISREKAFEVALGAEASRDFTELLGGITVGLSSGTSGNRGLFLVSEAERLAWCGNVLAKILPKAPWQRQKIALFLRASSTLYQTVHSKKLTFAYFDLLEDLATLKEKLRNFAPDILVAPPSMLLLLPGTCRPRRVISIAETLLSRDEELLQAAFGQPIHQIYQATEGFLAFTCSHGTLHLNEDLLHIEKDRIDAHRFAPIITDLFRKTQPIIRYRLDDILTEKSAPCPCGCPFQAIERIEGRSDDLLYVQTPSGHAKPLFPDFISRKILAASPHLETYDVVQTSPTEWRIYVEPSFQNAVLASLLALFNQINCIPPRITFAAAPPPRAPGAKLRRIRRDYETL